MRVIDVAVNGQLRWRAGMANASIIAPQLSAWVADESPASLRVRSMLRNKAPLPRVSRTLFRTERPPCVHAHVCRSSIG